MMSAQKQPTETVKFTFCKTFATADTKEMPWPDFAAIVTKSVAYPTKEASIKRGMIIGGVREDEKKGRTDNVKTREIVTLDYDDLAGVTLADVETEIELYMPKTSWLAYSTFRHTVESPRIRIMLPLSRTVNAAEYRAIVARLVDALDLGPADECSYTISQGMFLASHKDGVEPWSRLGGSGALDVDAMGLITTAEPETDVFDLDLAVASQPLDISEAEISALLENYPAETLGYDEWYKVGMALHHQHGGSDEGLAIWGAWCAVDADRYKPSELPKKWRSFGGSSSPVTMASVIKAAGGLKGGAVAVAPGGDVATTLEEDARAISTMAEYGAFKKRIVAMSAVQMPPDMRSMLAGIAHGVFAKGAGMGWQEVKASFKPSKAAVTVDADGAVEKIDAPDWLSPWCYYTADNVFIDASRPDLTIDGRAFDVKFAGEQEPRDAEIRPSDYATKHVMIPTVDRLFFMPDTPDRFCERNGFDALNTFQRGGVTPCAALDDDGRAVVDLFLWHLAWTFPDKAHQTLVLDWMAHVYQNQGQRVNWALLIWGLQGSGKTLLFNIMQRLVGSQNAKDVSPASLGSAYNDWAVGGIVGCIEEIRISGQNKWAIMDMMKPAITNDLLAINPKGKTSYSGAPNFCSYMMLTNHQDAIPVNDGDRRFCVLFSAHKDVESLEADHGGSHGLSEYFKRLFDGCVNRRPDAVARFLTDYKISAAFDYKGRAPRTGAFDEMVDANRSDEERMVRDVIDDHGSPILSKEVICVTELKAAVMEHGDAELPNTRALGQLLREMGYSPVGPKCYRVKGVKHYVWRKGAKTTDWIAKKLVRDFYEPSGEFADVPF